MEIVVDPLPHPLGWSRGHAAAVSSNLKPGQSAINASCILPAAADASSSVTSSPQNPGWVQM
jgi:hypothetical protein